MRALRILASFVGCFALSCSESVGADNSIIGEWVPLATATSGLGDTRTYETNGTAVVTVGAAVHFRYKVEANTMTLEGSDGTSQRMNFILTSNLLTFTQPRGQRQELERVKGTEGPGLAGKWTGKHYTGGKQVFHFTTNLNCYFSVPFQESTGSFVVAGNTFTETFPKQGETRWEWKVTDNVLTLQKSSGKETVNYRRKDSHGPFWDAAPPVVPRGVTITSGDLRSHVHANISKLRLEDFPALEKIHALFTVYFDGQGATDEKLQALAQLRFTNLACVVFTDCRLVTDQGIESVSQISSVTNLGLRGMSITDAACVTMVSRIRLHEVNMPRCTNVTVDGLSKMAQSKTIESLGFSVGSMSQANLIQVINTAGPKLNRMDIDMDGAQEERFDFPALRQAAKAKSITLYAVRNRSVSKL